MPRNLVLSLALLTAAGCASTQSPESASVEIKGSDPAATAPATAGPPLRTTADSRGIVSYDGYQAAVARSGDTVASVAQRVGLSASELGAYNGLSPSHPLRAGDELVLPPKPGGYATETQVPAAPASDPLIAQSDPAIVPAAPTTSAIEAVPLGGGVPGSGAGAANPAPTGGDGWSPDLAAAAIERAAGFDEQGNLASPPSAGEPLPPDPQAPGELASPQLHQYQTTTSEPLPPEPEPRPVTTITTPAEQPVEEPAQTELAAAAPQPEPTPQPAAQPAPQPAPQPTAQPAPQPAGKLKLLRPVQGPIVIHFQQSAGRVRNDGIDFAAPAGSPVIAAASGEVALVSQSLGGLGTIVLVRHPNDYLTVYGRIERVTVAKGDLVSRGQRIGVVSPSTQPRMHFEVRRGAESVDPEKFF